MTRQEAKTIALGIVRKNGRMIVGKGGSLGWSVTYPWGVQDYYLYGFVGWSAEELAEALARMV